MAIEFLTRISWLSNLQGPGIWAWLPGRCRQERFKPVPSGINKTTRTWAWAEESIACNVSLHSSSPPSGGIYQNSITPLQQFPFFPFFLHLLWVQGARVKPRLCHPFCSEPLQPGLHSSGAIWNCIPLSSWSIQHVCLWTCELLPFTYQQRSSLHPFLPLNSLEVSGGDPICTVSWKGLQQSVIAKLLPIYMISLLCRSRWADTGNIGEYGRLCRLKHILHGVGEAGSPGSWQMM